MVREYLKIIYIYSNNIHYIFMHGVDYHFHMPKVIVMTKNINNMTTIMLVSMSGEGVFQYFYMYRD